MKGADDWAYEHYGVQAFTFELWNPDLRSGGEGYAQVGFAALLARTDEQNLEQERKLLAWNDAELGGAGFSPWTPFVHPQLGPVELGGWDWKRSLQNAPEGPVLAEEARRAAMFITEHARALPLLTCSTRGEPLGAGLYKLSAEIRNVGGLPTNVTEMAVAVKAAPPIDVRLEGEGLQIIAGKARQEIEHLEGWAAAGGRAGRAVATMVL